MQIRWLIRRDMDEVVGIDESNGDYDTEDAILKRLGRTDTIGIVYDDGTGIVGYSVYQLGQAWIKIQLLAVGEDDKRQGIGSELLECIKNKLSPDRRKWIRIAVDEYNLAAQLFLRSNGFVCVGHGDELVFEYALSVRESKPR